MNKKISSLVAILALIFFTSSHVFGQFSLSYQVSKVHKGTIAYNFSKTVWTELRLSNNDNDGFIDLALLFNVSKKERHEVYLGVSCIAKDDEIGASIPFGVQFRPIETFKQLSFLIELQPLFTDDYEIQSSLGVRYKFRE